MCVCDLKYNEREREMSFFRCQMGFGSDYVTPTFADNIYNKKIAKEGVGLPSVFRFQMGFESVYVTGWICCVGFDF